MQGRVTPMVDFGRIGFGMIDLGRWQHVVQALRHRNHRLFNETLIFALTGIWAQRTAMAWLAWDLTHSPAWLGVIAAAFLLPALLIGPFSGVIADRFPPLHMMRWTQGIIMVHAAVLWLGAVMGLIEIWGLFALTLLAGINHPFSTAGRMVFYASLVPKEDLSTAIAINSTIFNLGRAIGPAIAGVLIANFSVSSAFAFNFLAFAAHLVNMFRIRMAPPERRDRGRKGMIGEIKEGLHYTLSHAGIAPILALLVISSIASRPVMDMMPGFADAVFGRGAEGLGWLLSAYGIGGVLAAGWLTHRSSVQGLTSLVIVQTLVMGAAIIIFAFIEFFWAGLALVMAFGFSHVITGTGTQTLMQTAVANQVRGRVMSLYAMVSIGMPAVGALVVGLIAERFGLGIATFGAGVICLAAWVWIRAHLKVMAPALETHPD